MYVYSRLKTEENYNYNLLFSDGSTDHIHYLITRTYNI